MVTTYLVINAINHFDDKKYPEIPEEALQPTAAEEEKTIEEATPEEISDLVDAHDSDDEGEVEDDEPDEQEQSIASRTRSRMGTKLKPPEKYTMAVKVNKN